MKITASPSLSLSLILLTSGAYFCRGEKPEVPQHGPRLCPTRTTCLDCLRDPFCGSWNNAGGCSPSCNSPDGSRCYNLGPSITYASYTNSETKEDVCARADNDEADAAICSARTDCGSCTETALSNGVGKCVWYKEGGYCGRPGCTLSPVRECGVVTCPAPKVEENNAVEEDSAPPPAQEANNIVEKDCSSYSNCLDCFYDSDCGGWSPDKGCSKGCTTNDLSCHQRVGNELVSTACMKAVARSSPSEADPKFAEGGDDTTIIMPNEKVEVKKEEQKQKKEKKKKKKGKRDRLRGRK